MCVCTCVCVCVCVLYMCVCNRADICCWTDTMSVRTKFQLCMVGHNTKMIMQASAK